AGVKMVIATVDGRSGGPILEFKVGSVTPHHGPTLVPHTRHGPHAPHHPPGNGPYDIELVRSLSPGNSPPPGRLEVFGRPRPVQPVAKIPVVQHAELA